MCNVNVARIGLPTHKSRWRTTEVDRQDRHFGKFGTKWLKTWKIGHNMSGVVTYIYCQIYIHTFIHQDRFTYIRTKVEFFNVLFQLSRFTKFSYNGTKKFAGNPVKS